VHEIGDAREQQGAFLQSAAQSPLYAYRCLKIMISKTLVTELVCRPHKVPRGAVADAKIFPAGQRLRIRDNETRAKGTGRMAVLVGDDLLFCDRKQFWTAVA
jgi:hypothetical protein